jgi:hypothetical protein
VGGGATLAKLPALVDDAKSHKLFQRGFDTFAREMTMEEGADLLSG